MARLTPLILATLLPLTGCNDQPSKPPYTVNDPTDANTTWKTLKPLTNAEASAVRKCPIELPRQATNIQYVDFYAGYGHFDKFVRFEAPADVCRDHAREVLQARNISVTQPDLKVRIGASPFDKSIADSLARLAREGVEEVARAPWFDPDAIKNGEIWGEHGGSKPLIFIDTDRGVFYYFLGD